MRRRLFGRRQKGNSLDNLLVVYRHVAALTATGLTLDTLKAQTAMLRTDAAKLLPPHGHGRTPLMLSPTWQK